MSPNIFLSSSCIKSKNIIDAVERLSNITKNIELSGGSSYDNGLLENLKKIKQQRGLKFLIHGYFPPPKEHFILNFADTSPRTRDFIRQSIKYADALRVSYYSIHSGFSQDFDFKDEILIDKGSKVRYSPDGMMQNIAWFRSEFPDIGLAIENLFPNGGNAECCFLMHIDDIVSFLDTEDDVSLLLDLGHLQVSARFFGFGFEDAAEFILENYAKKIPEIHLSENDGLFDDHRLISENSAQIQIVKRHRDRILKNKINIVIEARDFPIEELRKCYNLVCERVFVLK